MKKSVFGLDENIAGLLAYSLGIIVLGLLPLGIVSGVAVLVMERENNFVRFHALQSTIWFILLFLINVAVGLLFGWIPLIGGLISGIIWFFIAASAVFLMFNAYMGRKFKIPIIGDIVEGQLGS